VRLFLCSPSKSSRIALIVLLCLSQNSKYLYDIDVSPKSFQSLYVAGMSNADCRSNRPSAGQCLDEPLPEADEHQQRRPQEHDLCVTHLH
jgi:hypothetical protein